MKSIRIVTAVAIALAALIIVYAQTRQTIAVTTQTLAPHSKDKPFLMELTRDGKIYNIAAGIDYSRIKLRTEKGEMSLSEVIKNSKKTIIGPLLVGTSSDLSAINFGFPPGTLPSPGNSVSEVKCQDGSCFCLPGIDCIDMAKAKGKLCLGQMYCCQTCGTGGKRGCFCVKK